MAKGTIKQLFGNRGFGFIQIEEGQDIFFHANEVRGTSFDSLTEGQLVEFEVTDTPKGKNAVNVTLVGESG
tara:strand:+ start:302 stop:514 length:213 start_codon:yes stop_codon:yes gene_type:complete